jgi:hypothetical protein
MYLTYCVHSDGIKELINHKEFSGSPQGENVQLTLTSDITVGKSQGYRKRKNKRLLSSGL